MIARLVAIAAAALLASCGGGDPCEQHELPAPVPGQAPPVLVECD